VNKRHNFVHCAQMDLWDGKDPPSPTHRTWCGRAVPLSMEFQFTNANHALLNGRNAGRLMLCTDCAAAIKAALRAVAYRPKRAEKQPKS
jgi:hypothetical protein